MQTPSTIKIIKPGTYTSVEGTKVTFSLADLQSAADAYDAVSDPAPLVIGHPTMDAEAYGWAASLKVEDGHLIAEVDQGRLEPAFAEKVRAGRYRKVSGRFYQPDSPNNPKPGSFYLQHIGFLGAAAPAVKGLGTVNFTDGGGGLVTFDQAAAVSFQEQSMSDAQKTEAERLAELDQREASFAEREAALAAREDVAGTRETGLAEREAAVAEAARTAVHEANVAFCEALVGAGKLAPAAKALTVGVMDQLNSGDAVSFGEAGELTPLAGFKKLLEGAGQLVAFGELADPGKTGEEAPSDPQAIADRAVAFAEEQRASGRSITIASAVRHVMKDNAA